MSGLADCAVTRPMSLEPLVSKCLSELQSTDVAVLTQGAKDFQTILDSLLADLNLCKSDAADQETLLKIVDYLDTFPDAKSWDAHIKSDLLWNSAALAVEQAALLADLIAGKFTSVGTQAGLIFDRVVIGKNSFKGVGSTLPADIKKDQDDIMRGVLGSIGATGLENIEKCDTLPNFTTQYLWEMDGLLKLGLNTASASPVLKALESFGKTIETTGKFVDAQCSSHVQFDTKKLQSVANTFKSPASFEFHPAAKQLMVNDINLWTAMVQFETNYSIDEDASLETDVSRLVAWVNTKPNDEMELGLF